MPVTRRRAGRYRLRRRPRQLHRPARRPGGGQGAGAADRRPALRRLVAGGAGARHREGARRRSDGGAVPCLDAGKGEVYVAGLRRRPRAAVARGGACARLRPDAGRLAWLPGARSPVRRRQWVRALPRCAGGARPPTLRGRRRSPSVCSRSCSAARRSRRPRLRGPLLRPPARHHCQAPTLIGSSTAEHGARFVTCYRRRMCPALAQPADGVEGERTLGRTGARVLPVSLGGRGDSAHHGTGEGGGAGHRRSASSGRSLLRHRARLRAEPGLLRPGVPRGRARRARQSVPRIEDARADAQSGAAPARRFAPAARHRSVGSSGRCTTSAGSASWTSCWAGAAPSRPRGRRRPTVASASSGSPGTTIPRCWWRRCAGSPSTACSSP